MPSIYGAMNTAKMGLLTHQIALEVAGQNISNVNNKDFTRQQLQIAASTPVSYSGAPGMIGTGVRPVTVTRQQDVFLEAQRITNASQQYYWDERQNFLSRVEIAFNETGGYGLNNDMANFFKSWQQLAFNPGGMTERTDVIAQGRNIATTLGKLNTDLKNIRTDLESKVQSSVTEINRITTQIVDLNTRINEAEAFNVHANDLRDQRESLVRQLGQFTQVKTVEDATTKQIMVTLSSGRPLVLGQTAFQLSTQVRSDDPAASDIYLKDTDGNYFNITGELTGGSLGAWTGLRDTEIPDYLNRMDQFASDLMREVNTLHSEGFGLDGSTGLNFFTGQNPTAVAGRNNTGAATVTGAVSAPDLVNNHTFRIDFTAANRYNIVDVTLGSTVQSNVAYTSGTPDAYLQTQGLTVTVTGAAVTGDSFTVDPAKDASRTLQVNSALLADSRKVAAGLTTDAGNGENALRLAQIQDGLTMNKGASGASGTATFTQYYNSLVGDVGVVTKTATTMFNQQEAVNMELESRHEQISGVALDEEMVSLIKFQHAYQASARLVNVVDELLQTVLGLGA